MLALVIGAVAAALILGALWGLYGAMPKALEGFLIAMAGGALVIAVVLELLEPAAKATGPVFAVGFIAIGAIVFTVIDFLVDERWGGKSGGGLLAAVTLDGVPENLALGVALIGTGPMGVLSLAASIFLSNLPEAAGGARQMADRGFKKRSIVFIWGLTALSLSAAALIGFLLFENAPVAWLAAIKCFAGGAVIASLATEVFPTAYDENLHLAGIATALGLILAFLLHELG